MDDSLKPQLSIIIVNYKTPQMTLECIESIKAKTYGVRYEIIVIDNDSGDGSVEFLQERLDGIIMIKAPENLGFGRANNIGVSAAKADTIFLLNSDTVIIDNSIKTLYDYLKTHPDTGACGGLLLNRDGSIGYSTSPQLTLGHYFRAYIPRIKRIPTELYAKEPVEVGYVIGADMMVRREAFERAGGFDPDFFLYCEESELSFRIKKLGYRIMLVPESRIIHLEGMSGTKIKQKSEFIQIEQAFSRFLYFRKVYNRRYPWYLYMLFMSQYTISLLRGAFKSHRRSEIAYRMGIMHKAFRKYLAR